MKFIKTLIDTFKVAPTKLKLAVGVTLAGSLLAGLMVAGFGITSAGFGPDRPVYDWNNPADRVGSTTGPVLNSFINTDVYGDERAFLDGKDNANTQPGDFKDQLPVEPGKEYLLRMYIHNDANQSINESGVGVAKNTKVRVKILPGFANGQGVTGYINADNDIDRNGNAMGELHDTVDLRNDTTKFALDYVEGSARIVNDAHPSGLALSDSIVDTGVPIGYNAMNGDLPGCFEFSAYVTIRVKVVAPDLEVQKTVRRAGETQWQESVNAKPGETVQWFVKVTNTGDAQANNVVARDELPDNLAYVDGTAKWFNPNARDIAYDFSQFSKTPNGGMDFGSYNPDSNFLVRFDTKVGGDFSGCSITLKNIALAYSSANVNEVSDGAQVVVTKENCAQVTPSYACNALEIARVKDRNYRFTTKVTATNGAEVRRYHYNFGDGMVLVTDKNVVEHPYAKDGDYAASVKVEFLVNGKLETVDVAVCRGIIKVTTATTPTTVLPKTGPGDAAGLFAAVTTIGTVAYRLRLSRKLS